MAMSFSKQVSGHIEKYRKRLVFTAKTATNEVFNAAQVTVSKGGRMRVDTGFLRASAVGKIGSMPSGPSSNPEGRIYSQSASVGGETVVATILRWQPMENAIYIGWTANYARWREYQDGFMRGATERWQEFVKKAAALSRRKFK